MANTFLNSTIVQDRSDLALYDSSIITQLGSRNVEQEFASKVGDTVYARLPGTHTAVEFIDGTSTTSASNVTQTQVPIQIAKHFVTRIDINSKEDLLNEDNFMANVMLPGMQSIIDACEDYGTRRLVGGFAPAGVTGTAGTEVSTTAQLFLAEKTIFQNKGNTQNLNALLTPTSFSSLAQVATNISLLNTPEGPANLQGNMVGPVANIKRLIRSRYAGDAPTVALAGTVITKGTGVAGNRVSITLDGISNADGTLVPTGYRFQIADTVGIFTALEDAVVDTGEVTIIVKAPASWADGKAETAETAVKENVIFNPASVAIAILPGMAGSNAMIVRARDLGGNDAGFGIRVIETEISGSTLYKSFIFDAFMALAVIEPKHGIICN